MRLTSPLDVLKDRWEHSLKEMLSEQLNSPAAILSEAIRYALLSGGKRIRPLLILSLCTDWDIPITHGIPLALSVECIHTYSLIHDDLPAMDNDEFRRGKPTVHKVFGEANAILAGDALQTLAFEWLASDLLFVHYSGQQMQRLFYALTQASGAAGMVSGQVLDLDKLGSTPLHQIRRLKTGVIFECCVKMVIIISEHMTLSDRNILSQWSEHFGLAFQIQDDIDDQAQDLYLTADHVQKDRQKLHALYDRMYQLLEQCSRRLPHTAALLSAIEASCVAPA